MQLNKCSGRRAIGFSGGEPETARYTAQSAVGLYNGSSTWPRLAAAEDGGGSGDIT